MTYDCLCSSVDYFQGALINLILGCSVSCMNWHNPWKCCTIIDCVANIPSNGILEYSTILHIDK